MKESLIRGDRLYQMLALVGFSDNIVTQISLADKHGNLLGSLTKIETYMLRMTKVRKKLMEVATYPILLPVSYTHLDVYKRQVLRFVANVWVTSS